MLSDKDNYLYAHRDMIESLYLEGLSNSIEEAEKRVTDRVNTICKNILFNTAVFKADSDGQAGFERFLTTVGG